MNYFEGTLVNTKYAPSDLDNSAINTYQATSFVSTTKDSVSTEFPQDIERPLYGKATISGKESQSIESDSNINSLAKVTEPGAYTTAYLKQMRNLWCGQVLSALNTVKDNIDTTNVIMYWRFSRKTMDELWKYSGDIRSPYSILLGNIDMIKRDINWENITENKVAVLIEIFNRLKGFNEESTQELKSIINIIKNNNFDSTLTSNNHD